MNPKLAACIVVIAGFLAVCGPVSAHHGNSAYDEVHQIAVTGTVTEFVWANPHCQIYMDVKDDQARQSIGQSKLKVRAFSAAIAGPRLPSSRETKLP